MNAQPGTVVWSELLVEATRRLERGGFDTAALDTRRIVEEATGCESGRLHEVLDEPATELGLARFDAMVTRRGTGEPLQYVLGRWGFRTLDLFVDARVLIPRPETEVVAGLAIDEVNARVANRSGDDADVVVADLGTGSGAIALSVAVECPTVTVMASDRSRGALAVARANLAGIGRAAVRGSLYQGDWFAALPDSVRGRLDVIVANPPYVLDDEELPSVVADWEPVDALRAGPEGLDDLRRIVDDGPGWLAPGGALVLEMAPDQTGIVAQWCSDRGLQAVIHDDLTGRPRAVVARSAR